MGNKALQMKASDGALVQKKSKGVVQREVDFLGLKLTTYTVKSGDTFNQIAYDNNMTPKELKKLNPNIKNTSLIDIGNIINLTDQNKISVEPTLNNIEPINNDFQEDNHITIPQNTNREIEINEFMKNINTNLYNRSSTVWAQEPTRKDIESIIDLKDKSTIEKLGAVNANNAFQEKGGTKANWGAFIYMGVGGIRNDSLSDSFVEGTWTESEERTDKETKNDLYSVEDTQFMKDIMSRKPYQDGIKRVKNKLKKIKSQDEVGKLITNKTKFSANFTFAGQQTVIENQYGDLEWDLGSYSTNIYIDNYNPKTGEVKVSIITKNEFHISSLTRINADAQNTITDKLDNYVNKPINTNIDFINNTFNSNIPADINLISPKSLLSDTNNEYLGGSYDVEFKGTDVFNIND